MNKLSQRNKKSAQGFTIIEVVLVLAIAALIFLMVFIALPALQRGQRDAGRKNDVSTVVSALQTYMSNSRGILTGVTDSVLQGYVENLGQYDVPSFTATGLADSLTVANGVAPVNSITTTRIDIRTGAKCPVSMPAPGATSLTPQAAGSRQAAVITALENNGSSVQVYCQSL